MRPDRPRAAGGHVARDHRRRADRRSKVGGSAAGRRYLFCTVTQTAPSIETALYNCQVTYVLGRGTITASGVVRVDRRSVAAITGGTGAYAGAKGTLISAPGTDTLTLRR